VQVQRERHDELIFPARQHTVRPPIQKWMSRVLMLSQGLEGKETHEGKTVSPSQEITRAREKNCG